VAAALAGLVLLPPLDYRPMIAARGATSPQLYAFVKEGRTSVVSLATYARNTELANNGLRESMISRADPNRGASIAVLLGAIPYLLHPDPKSAFQVGFGGGITTYTLTTTDLTSIHVVELEPVILDAVRHLHGGTVPALQDPRLRLDIDDARHRLLLDADTYDLIVSQPSHPWVAGAANVFTREFDRLVADKLNPGGIAIQWVNLFRMDVTTLGAILNAFYGVFPHGAAFGTLRAEEGALLLVGSERPLDFDRDRIARRLASPALARGQVPALLDDPDDLFRYYLLSRDEALALGAGAPVNTDTNILSEVRLARLERSPKGPEDPFPAVVAVGRYDVAPFLAKPRSSLYRFGRFFIRQDEFHLAERAEARLGELDPTRARWLRHERLANSFHDREATALYLAHDDWPETAHESQAVVFMESGHLAEAADAVGKITRAPERRLAELRLLFFAQRWGELEAYPAATPAERAWQLIGVFQRDPAAGAAGLLELAMQDPTVLELPQLRLLNHYRMLHPGFGAGRFDIYNHLFAQIYFESQRLVRFVREAKRDGDMDRVRLLVARLDAMVGPGSALARQIHREVLPGTG
jgi:hypothetical protein